ncbi:hypothetical protein ACQEV9_15050 [Streptomyces chartreusis]|uniref:hypothetical protein n=1 Tax=Streptomyces chartreusis TaxID=1969 RepID=UPI003D8D5FDA
MMETAFVAAVAVIIGAVVAGMMQYVNYRVMRHDHRFQTAVEALSTLLGATADYQSQQHLAHTLRAQQLDETLEILKARHEARAVVVRAMTAVRLSNSDGQIIRLADELVTATFALEQARDHPEPLRMSAVAAHSALQDAAASHIHRHAKVALPVLLRTRRSPSRHR